MKPVSENPIADSSPSVSNSDARPQPYAFGSRFVSGLAAASPLMVIMFALAIVLFHILADTELTLLDYGNAPEYSMRLIGMGAVILLSVVVPMPLCLAMVHPGLHALLVRYSGRILDAQSLGALIALGAAFAVFDMSFNIGESTEAVLIALTLGFLAAGPLFFRRAGGLRRRLVVIALFGVFAGWITVQRQIDWNMRRPFLRTFSKIQIGMSMGQVEAVVRHEFRGKRPKARFGDWGVQYTLDPDDGRFNSEFIVIQMIDGKVVSTDYSPD